MEKKHKWQGREWLLFALIWACGIILGTVAMDIAGFSSLASGEGIAYSVMIAAFFTAIPAIHLVNQASRTEG